MTEEELRVESRKLKVKQQLAALLTRFSNFAFRFSDLTARVPWRLVLAAAGLFILVWAWREHDARLRRDLELQQLQQQTSAQVAALRARADTLLSAANEKNARVIRDLDSRRRQLGRKGEELRRGLLRLQEEEGQRLAEVDSLPAAVVAKRVAERLGIRDSGREEQEPGARGQGPGKRDSASKGQASGVGGQGPGTRESGEYRREAPNPQSPTPNPSSSAPSPELALTEEGARRVETAFIELDSCREQAAAKDGALANCQEQVDANRAMVGELNKSVNDLNQAIRAKDEILARVEAQHRAELKAARGSRLRRFVRAVQYVGVGVVIGVAVAH
jgi:uncharacterized protein YlxW (UPF0749 family)